LTPLFSQDAQDIDVEGIQDIAPPEWILGEWALGEEENTDEPFILEFTENDIIMDYSLTKDIESGYVVAFSQKITEDYYEIYVKFDDGYCYKERFFLPPPDKKTDSCYSEMQSLYSDNEGTSDYYTYYFTY